METETTTTRPRYDRAQMMTDLEAGMTPREVAEKHGCSIALAQTVRRKMRGEDAKPKNETRAALLRKRAAQLQTDLDLLAKWAEADDTGAVNETHAAITRAATALEEAASSYEQIPASAMARTKKKAGKIDLAPGMIVRVKDKRVPDYTGITASPDYLKVVAPRERDVLVEDEDGARLFFPRKDLELKVDA